MRSAVALKDIQAAALAEFGTAAIVRQRSYSADGTG
jgi:hypothetical protein